MTAPPAIVRPRPPAAGRAPGPLGWIVGAVAALAATAVAVVVALLFAAALAVVVVLALILVLLAFAAARVRRGDRVRSPVISARWTGYGWDAG